ncbi:MAG TPA: ribonuclease III [Phycisphaerae bacterium]|nr:ribonuclease III [Phycisphaerae bacterium]
MAKPDVLEKAQKVLEYRFQNPKLLEAAITHASSASDRLESNERMEFLGDAVLGLIICRRVYELYPDRREGQLTVLKSAVVSRKTCAAVSDTIGLTELIRVGPGMEKPGRLPHSLAAGVFEAVIGAIYLDGGYEPAAGFVLKHMQPWLDRYAESAHQHNFKSVLQQYVQRTMTCTPVYEVLEESGPDHNKSFRVRVLIGSKAYDPSWGHSKKQAEQDAAFLALQALGIIDREGLDVSAQETPAK